MSHKGLASTNEFMVVITMSLHNALIFTGVRSVDVYKLVSKYLLIDTGGQIFSILCSFALLLYFYV